MESLGGGLSCSQTARPDGDPGGCRAASGGRRRTETHRALRGLSIGLETRLLDWEQSRKDVEKSADSEAGS